MNANDVRRWFEEYVEVYVACGRGERDPARLLGYYGVPFLVTSDAGFVAMTSPEQVVALAKQQADQLRAANYHHSKRLSDEVIVLNSRSALYRGTFSRHRGDDSEISRVTVTYLVTNGTEGRRISALMAHSP